MIRSEMSQPFQNGKRRLCAGIPFYLLVPRGLKESAQKLAGDASVPVSGIYEYTFVNGVCQVR